MAGNKLTSNESNPFDNDPECSIDEFAKDFPCDVNDVVQRISYQELMIQMGELARTVQNDQSQCSAVFTNVNQMIKYYRNGTSFEMRFLTQDVFSSTTINVDDNDGLPLAAVTRPLRSNATRSKRKKSSLEYQSSQYSQRDNVEMSQTSLASACSDVRDNNYLPPPKVRTRSCVLCAGKGHGQFTCVKLLEYGNAPLEKNNMNVRTKLHQDLSQDKSFQTSYRDDDDDRLVFDNFPIRYVKAVVLHRRLVIDKSIVKPLQPSNYCIECTILVAGGEPDPRYTKGLFHHGDVGSYITRSKANLVVSLLQKS